MAISAGELIQARFIKEEKNRFICKVEIGGNIVECYVPSSCRLANFLELEDKPVLVRPTVSPSVRTAYALLAIPYKRSYLMLNSFLANRVIENSVNERRFSFLEKRTTVLKEHRVEGYKADLYIEDSKTIIEIKSIMSTSEVALFPTVYSERAIKQLEALKALIQCGYKACYIIVSLNPYVKQIKFDTNATLYQLFTECKVLGMQAKGFTCRLKDGYISIEHEIPLR